MTSTVVHLIRHGEVHNPEKILYGRLPGYRLSGRGNSQAARCARAFHGHDVTYLAVSPLQRAQETAAPFAASLNLEIHTDDRLIEAGNQLEGLHIKGIDSALWNPRYWSLLTNPLQPSWGERYADIRDRMLDAVEDVRARAEGHEGIIVSHQLPIVMVQRHVAGRPLAHNPALRQCNLTSVTSLTFNGTTIVDVAYSEPSAIIS